MSRLRVLIVFFCVAWPTCCPGTEPPFVPIPDAEKPLYRFDLKKWFYVDEAARAKNLADLKTMTWQIDALKTVVGTDPGKLLEAIELKQRMGVVADRLQAYGGFRYAVNTNDATVMNEGEEARSGFDAATAFVESTVQGLSDAQLSSFVAAVPGLTGYQYLLQSWRRNRPHRGAEPAEALLAALSPRLDPFKSEFYTLMIGRTPDATVMADGRALNVTRPNDYAEVLRLPDRGLRESGFRKWLAGFKAQSDLYAFALLQKAKTANTVADYRKFPNAADDALFDYYLTPQRVDAVLKGFRDKADLAIRFQKAEKAYQQQLLQLAEARPWDLEARPATAPEPRFVISDASRAVIEATRVFGPEYRAELTDLLDPRNGRLDLVAGPNRKDGDFTWGSYGPAWVFYMQGYNGFLTDVVTLAHESAHAVHFRLLYKNGVPWYYGDGARYFTEGFAKVNELLILEHLASGARTKTDRLLFLRELNSKLASVKFAAMYWAAYATSFETEVYRRVKNGAVEKPEKIHEIWAEFGRLWSLDFDSFSDQKYTWAGTHHFFDSSRYYSNYLFAWVLALAVYERQQADPTFADKYVKLMKTGFSDEPAVLLRSHIGIDLADPTTLARLFAVVEKRLGEFEREVQVGAR